MPPTITADKSFEQVEEGSSGRYKNGSFDNDGLRRLDAQQITLPF